MKEHDKRVALRLPGNQRQQIDALIKEGKFKSLSQVIRAALNQFLKQNEVSQ